MTEHILFCARLARRFDAIAYGLLATAVIVAHPRLGLTLLGELSTFYMLPLAGLIGATVTFPVRKMNRFWQDHFLRLQMAGLVTLGLAPFLSWWLRTIDQVYLAVVGSLAIYAAIWYGIELLHVLQEIYRQVGAEELAGAVRRAHVFLVYLVLIPVLAVHVSFITAYFAFPGIVLSDLRGAWSLVPLIVRYVMLVAALNLVWQILRVHNVLLQENPDFGQKEELDERCA